jgi:hypothetical protein
MLPRTHFPALALGLALALLGAPSCTLGSSLEPNDVGMPTDAGKPYDSGQSAVAQSADSGATGDSGSNSADSGSALQDFQTRCAQPGVILCQGFDDPSVFGAAVWPASGLYADDNGNLPTQDSTEFVSGGGSLKFTIPSDIGSNMGYWRQLLTPDLSAGPSAARMFGANSSFYVQYHQRFSPEFMTNNWQTSDGSQTSWKQSIFSFDDSTCGNVELTTVRANWQPPPSYPVMYSQCGDDGFVVDLGNGDYMNEQAASAGDVSYNCHYQAANNVPGSCFLYPANTWVTFYFKVVLGNWDQPNSSIQAWVALPGQPYVEFVNMQNHTLHEDTPGQDYDMVTLLPYMTGRDPSRDAGPTAYTWYDELIVSTNPIALPQP